MARLSKDDLIAALPALSDSELRQVRAAADILCQTTMRAPKVLETPDARLFYKALIERLRTEGALRGAPVGEGELPFSRMPRFDAGAFTRALDACREQVFNKLVLKNRAERLLLMHLLCEAAAIYVRDRHRHHSMADLAIRLYGKLKRSTNYVEAVEDFVEKFAALGSGMSLTSLVAALHDPVAVLDHSYPGYLENGTLLILIEGRSSDDTREPVGVATGKRADPGVLPRQARVADPEYGAD